MFFAVGMTTGGAELFPLPLPPACTKANLVNFSRKVRGRASLKSEVATRFRNGVFALNELFGCPGESSSESSHAHPTEAQLNSLNHLHDCISSALPPKDFVKPDVALTELLRQRPGYLNAVDGQSQLAPYDAERLSTPDGTKSGADLVGILPDDDVRLLSGVGGGLLRTQTEFESVVAKDGKAKPFLCPSLYDRDKYVSFLSVLRVSGMLKLSRFRKEDVTPFFVHKKGGRIRLILDDDDSRSRPYSIP